MTARPAIGITDYPVRSSALKRRLYDRIRTWADLTLLDPDVDHPRLPDVGLDLYHMARWSRPALRDLARACDAGIPTVNSYEGAAALEDRLGRCRRIEAAGIRVPDYEFGTAASITMDPPVVVKPRYELEPGGHDFSVVYEGPLAFEGERFVQRYVVPRRSYKAYGVGPHVRSTRHLAGTESARETVVSSALEGLVGRVGTLFDLALFELDFVVHKGLYVIDVNPSVSLVGVPDAIPLYERLLRRTLAGG